MKSIPSPHIPFAKLADLIEERLAPNERAASLAHAAACALCREQMAGLTRTVELMRTDVTEDAPPHVIARALHLFPPRDITDDATKPSVWRRILATLSFDSAQLTPAFGLRSAQPAAARQLLFSAGENDLDLRIAPGGEGWVVSGQVLGGCTGGGVELQGAVSASQTILNNLCEFTLPPVPAGSYTLRLRLGDSEVEVPGLELLLLPISE